MPLSLFCDALPYSEIHKNYVDWIDKMEIAPLIPNIAYSSSLHWQLYCDKYPDARGVFVDWVKEPETNRAIRMVSTLLSPLDFSPKLGWLSRKILDRIVFRRNAFANIPYKFRKEFSEKGQYLFWDKNIYTKEDLFQKYSIVSQDEGHISFEQTIQKLNLCISTGEKNIFSALGFADSMGHTCRRGIEYSNRLRKYMNVLRSSIQKYIELHPEEQILIVSDHGMSTVNQEIDLNLESKFGKPSKKNYIAYSDSAIMCIWSDKDEVRKKMASYLRTVEYGHLLTGDERAYYQATDKKFGDLVFILKEGYVFEKNWFGINARKPSVDGKGMHGFWPEKTAKDQIASIILINGKLPIKEYYNYKEAHLLIKDVMGYVDL